jgi:hypothetical protein
VLCSICSGVNLDFDSGVYPFLYTASADKDAAVAPFGYFEVEFEREVAVAFFGPDVEVVSANTGNWAASRHSRGSF